MTMSAITAAAASGIPHAHFGTARTGRRVVAPAADAPMKTGAHRLANVLRKVAAARGIYRACDQSNARGEPFGTSRALFGVRFVGWLTPRCRQSPGARNRSNSVTW